MCNLFVNGQDNFYARKLSFTFEMKSEILSVIS